MIKINKNIISKERVATFGFIIIFPFFIIYHTLIAFSMISPIFGSLLGYASVIIICLFFLSAIFNTKKKYRFKLNYHELAFWIFCLYCLSWSLFYLIYKGYLNYIEVSFNQVIAFLIVFIAHYLIGRFLYLDGIKKYNKYSLNFFFILIALYYIFTGNVSFMPNRVGGAEDVVASYQSFSTIVLTMSLIALVKSKSAINHIYISFVSLVIMFFLSSRSDFLGLLIGITIYFIFFTKLKYKLLFTLIIIGFTPLLFGLNFESLSANRIFELNSLDSSGSWSSRKVLEEVAKQQIRDSPLLGFFGGQTYYFGLPGAYSHNIYSSWVTFGFIGFFIYLFLIFSPLLFVFKWMRLKVIFNSLMQLIFIFSIIIILFTLLSKSVFWMTPAFVWGLVSNRANSL